VGLGRKARETKLKSVQGNGSLDKIRNLCRWIVYKNVLRRRSMKAVVQGSHMYLDLANKGISKALAVDGIREADHTEIIGQKLRPGMRVMDVGANIGYYPLIEASIVGGGGKVYAFEPDPRNIELLRKNVSLNGLECIVEIYGMALSNKVGRGQMCLTDKTNLNMLASRGNSGFLADHIVERIKVDVTTVDEFVRDKGEKLDFLRMDVEGGEVEVLEGMVNTLKEANKGFRILLELHPQAYSESRSLAEHLRRLFGMGYVAEIVISAGEPRPEKFAELGYHPKRVIQTDGFQRGWYEDVGERDVISLTCFEPKISRYILLKKG